MVQDLSSKNAFLNKQNAVLAKDLSETNDSTAMILENARDQNKGDLAKFLREREAAAATSAVAASKIAEREEEVLSLQNSFADQNAQDEAAKEEMRRFMQAQKDRGEQA